MKWFNPTQVEIFVTTNPFAMIRLIWFYISYLSAFLNYWSSFETRAENYQLSFRLNFSAAELWNFQTESHAEKIHLLPILPFMFSDWKKKFRC